LGVADSFTITGALSWGLARIGLQKGGTVMAWVGTAIYAAFALGAPLGSLLYAQDGFLAIALATIAFPLAALVLLACIPYARIAQPLGRPAALALVARAVWQPGLGLACGGVGFGAITTFIALLFVERGWEPIWLAFTVFSAALLRDACCSADSPTRGAGRRSRACAR
jgi:MFS family permease